jgi:hypothetical protein
MKKEMVNSKSTKELLKFLNETIEGKYTENKPVLVDIKFRRIEIQEQDEDFEPVNNDENLLFGSSY